jgi:GTP-binding protein
MAPPAKPPTKPPAKPPFTPETPASSLDVASSFNWYWETFPPILPEKAAANHFFTKFARPEFLRSAGLFRQIPESDVPEVAFVGRSNVGKSSLLNALVNADLKSMELARTGARPGVTTTMNLYGVGGHDGVHIRKGKNNGFDKIVGIGGVLFVDLPGYGEGSLSSWGPEIMKYLLHRKQLRRVFVLVDAAVGLKDNDRSLLASLRLAGVSHQVLLSKCDKLYIPLAKYITRLDQSGKSAPSAKASGKAKGSVEDLRKTMEKVKEEIQPKFGGGALGELLAVSSEVLVSGKRLGIDSVRVAVMKAAGMSLNARNSKGKLITAQSGARRWQPKAASAGSVSL